MKCLDRIKLYQYAGNLNQIMGARRMRIEGGTAGDMLITEVKTGSGLEFSVLEDKCLDIYDLRYKGINLAYFCKNGLVHGERASVIPGEFMKLFTGGGLFTCGLMNVMAHCEDVDGTQFQKHGAAQHRQAEQVYVRQGFDADDYKIELGGKVTETKVLGYHLQLSRRIETQGFSNTVTIFDRIENLDGEPEGVQICYHMNLGYPFIDKGSYAIFPKGNRVEPLTRSVDLSENYGIMPEPVVNGVEQVSINRMPIDAYGFNRVLVVNDSLGLGVLVECRQDTLPAVCFWKCPRAGDYVMGIEPTNALNGDRVTAKKNGTLDMIAPYGHMDFEFRFTVLEGEALASAKRSF